MKTSRIQLIARSPWRCGFLLITLSLACFVLASAPNAFAVNPPPDGGYDGFNTAEGTDALFSNTTGQRNTGLGFQALYSNTTSSSIRQRDSAPFSATRVAPKTRRVVLKHS